MKPDPRFPNRPTHPDFDRLSAAVTHNDTVEEAPNVSAEFRRRVEKIIDEETLFYVAAQRVLRMRQRSGVALDETVTSAAWVDGFMAAATMFLGQGVEDGRHR